MSLYHKVLAALFQLRGPIEMADRLNKSGVKKVTVSDRGGVSVDEVDGAFRGAIDNAAKIAARGWVTTGLTQEDVEFFKKRCPLPKFPFGGESIVDKLEAHMVEQLHFQNEQLALKIEEHENRNGLLKDHLKRALYRVREVVAENKHLQSSLDAAYAEIRRLTSTETLVIENMALKDDLMIAKATIKILTAKGPNQ